MKCQQDSAVSVGFVSNKRTRALEDVSQDRGHTRTVLYMYGTCLGGDRDTVGRGVQALRFRVMVPDQLWLGGVGAE